MATYLYRTFSTATNRRIWTWSAWVKRQNLVSDYQNAMFGAYYDGSNRSVIRFHGHVLEFQDTANSVQIKTNRLFRDMNGWFHILVRVDTTQSTASDRVRLYVNGEQETSFSQADYPSQNLDMEFQGSVVHYINARRSSAVDSIADMSYSHVHFADGQSLAPTVFGSTDSTTGEWTINTNPSFTLGTNGFTILKDGNTYTDQSSNSNNWTLAGSTGVITKIEDCPDNVFATWNPLSPNDSITYSNGNLTVTGSNATNYSMSCSTTLGASSGKYYWEMKYVTAGNGNECIGVANFDRYEYNQNMTSGTTGYVSLRWDGERQINNVSTTYFTPPSTGAILMCAMDMDNGKVFFGSNGVWFGSGNPVTGANPTADILTSGTWGGILRYLSSKWECNFGNGYFGTTEITTNTGTGFQDADGNGRFFYNPPTNFRCLSTKGLNQ